MSPEMVQTLAYFVGGVLGSGLRSAMTTSQAFLSRKTAVDLIVGGIVGIIYPLYPIIGFPHSANLIQQSAIIAALSYAGGDFVQNILNRIQSVQAVLGPPPRP